MSHLAVKSDIIWNIMLVYTIMNLKSSLDHIIVMNFNVVSF